jgi:hypothetical protein
MQDLSFLPNLIDEDIYVIKEKGVVQEKEVVQEILVETESKVEVEIKVEPAPADPIPILVPVIENKAEEPKVVYTQPLPTEGSNLKHCIVIVESSEAMLDNGSKTFLENILKSVKRSLDDILLVNAKDANDEQIQALLAEQNHRHLLCFGSEKLTFLKNIQAYAVHSENHKFYLKADGLDLISTTVDKKKALWTALKEMFL